VRRGAKNTIIAGAALALVAAGGSYTWKADYDRKHFDLVCGDPANGVRLKVDLARGVWEQPPVSPLTRIVKVDPEFIVFDDTKALGVRFRRVLTRATSTMTFEVTSLPGGPPIDFSGFEGGSVTCARAPFSGIPRPQV
jgi:hypothetical protein